jgi:hypothetical protein
VIPKAWKGQRKYGTEEGYNRKTASRMRLFEPEYEPIVVSLCDKTGNMVKEWAEAGFTCYCVDLQHSVRKDVVKQVGTGKVIYTYGDARSWTPPAGTYVVFFASFPVCTNMAGSGAQDYSNLNGRLPNGKKD